jgi:5-methylcytosine-specific restriction endonuclease McrA
MKNKKPNAEQIWKQFEDLAVPRVPMSMTDRGVYSHLLRHSHLEGRRQLRFSIACLAHGALPCMDSARQAVRRLVEQGTLRLIERGGDGHTVEVRLPKEIRGARGHRTESRASSWHWAEGDRGETDFLQTRSLRSVIHARERGQCFYCLRRVPRRVRCLDHVVPRAQKGGNSYRNLVSCCLDCNTKKGETRAEDFLRSLYRGRRLNDRELEGRLRALEAFASGKLPPPLAAAGSPIPRKGRPPLTLQRQREGN